MRIVFVGRHHKRVNAFAVSHVSNAADDVVSFEAIHLHNGYAVSIENILDDWQRDLGQPLERGVGDRSFGVKYSRKQEGCKAQSERIQRHAHNHGCAFELYDEIRHDERHHHAHEHGHQHGKENVPEEILREEREECAGEQRAFQRDVEHLYLGAHAGAQGNQQNRRHAAQGGVENGSEILNGKRHAFSASFAALRALLFLTVM